MPLHSGPSPRAARLAPAMAVALALAACADRTTPASDSPQSVAAPAAHLSASFTPGMCGPWEVTDSARLDACRRKAFRSVPPGRDSIFGGDCGYWQTLSLDSLRACLTRADSIASACPEVLSWLLRQPDGGTRRAEWRRCGPAEAKSDGDSIVWPIHILLIRRDTSGSALPLLVHSNLEDPGLGGLDTAVAVDFDGDGYDELWFIDHVYGTGAIFEDCALTVTEGRFRCWTGPDFSVPDGGLAPGEALFKGWILVPGPPDAAPPGTPPSFAAGRSLWYTTQVYREGDANCCPSAGASLWVEARPDSGRFRDGLMLRVREDSVGTPTGVDTLRLPRAASIENRPARVTLGATSG